MEIVRKKNKKKTKKNKMISWRFEIDVDVFKFDIELKTLHEFHSGF